MNPVKLRFCDGSTITLRTFFIKSSRTLNNGRHTCILLNSTRGFDIDYTLAGGGSRAITGNTMGIVFHSDLNSSRFEFTYGEDELR
ncbi:hypothetical protein E2C01_086316 [Portunus trituberculatus]|uniref:Uncharacterized protein n=1 Tax=Portunus trituberculatus TaxID=210409 RepID=A0A5B7J0F9_PORTR|nr:hypothetical protein [Portunus trituberculatus]